MNTPIRPTPRYNGRWKRVVRFHWDDGHTVDCPYHIYARKPEFFIGNMAGSGGATAWERIWVRA